jgi:hypothetical protein
MNETHQVTCPSCLNPLREAVEVCPDCQLKLPTNYCQTCYEAPALPIVAIGFRQHAKTHLLAALLLTIEHLPSLLPDVSYRLLGDFTLQRLIAWRKAERIGRKLEPTEPRDLKIEPREQPLIVSLSGFYDPRTLLIYDVAGENFQDLEAAHEHLPVLRAAQTVWFVASSHDLEHPKDNSEDEGRLMSDLFASYQTAMQKLGASLDGRNAVIVLTKGDLVESRRDEVPRDWPQEYIKNDPCAPHYEGEETFSLENYEQTMEALSGRLEKYIQDSPGGRNLVTLLRKHKMNVSFCLTAPLGADPSEENGTKVMGGWKRQRVLDPLILTLRLAKERVESRSLHLILDAGTDAAAAYAQCAGAPLPKAIWERLSKERDVRVWFLGQSAPAVPPRLPPPTAPPTRARPRLIGPLLESLPPTSRAVVVTQGVILDLEDFQGSAWSDRLLLVATSDSNSVVNSWNRAQTVVFKTEDDLGYIASLVERLA